MENISSNIFTIIPLPIASPTISQNQKEEDQEKIGAIALPVFKESPQSVEMIEKRKSGDFDISTRLKPRSLASDMDISDEKTQLIKINAIKNSTHRQETLKNLVDLFNLLLEKTLLADKGIEHYTTLQNWIKDLERVKDPNLTVNCLCLFYTVFPNKNCEVWQTARKLTQSIYNQPQFSDALISYQDPDDQTSKVFHVNKKILAQFSHYFAKAFESGFQEKEKNAIEFNALDISLPGLEGILRYIYQFDIDLSSNNSSLKDVIMAAAYLDVAPLIHLFQTDPFLSQGPEIFQCINTHIVPYMSTEMKHNIACAYLIKVVEWQQNLLRQNTPAPNALSFLKSCNLKNLDLTQLQPEQMTDQLLNVVAVCFTQLTHLKIGKHCLTIASKNTWSQMTQLSSLSIYRPPVNLFEGLKTLSLLDSLKVSSFNVDCSIRDTFYSNMKNVPCFSLKRLVIQNYPIETDSFVNFLQINCPQLTSLHIDSSNIVCSYEGNAEDYNEKGNLVRGEIENCWDCSVLIDLCNNLPQLQELQIGAPTWSIEDQSALATALEKIAHHVFIIESGDPNSLADLLSNGQWKIEDDFI